MGQLILAGTGHRPNKLGGYSGEVEQLLIDLAEEGIKKYSENSDVLVISGMALGWDQALAQAAVSLNVPFLAAIPFRGQERTWPTSSRFKYQQLLSQAKQVEYVCDDGYAAWKMQKRNEWMVDRANLVLALWDGTSGGTANCIYYAASKQKNILNLWPQWLEKKSRSPYGYEKNDLSQKG